MPRDDRIRGPEDEGIPDLQDGSPEQEWAEDPQQMPLPADEPASEDYGVTAEEAARPEPLGRRLAREEPDAPASGAVPGDPDTRGAAGRLVAPVDQGRPAEEEDGYALDEGGDGGGFSPEEDAVHVADDPGPMPVFDPRLDPPAEEEVTPDFVADTHGVTDVRPADARRP